MHPSPSAGTVRPPSVRVCMAASCSGAEPVDERGLEPTGNRRGPARSSGPQRRVPPARGVLSAGPVESYGLGSRAALVAGVLAASPARTAPSPPSLARVRSVLAGRLSTLRAAVQDDPTATPPGIEAALEGTAELG